MDEMKRRLVEREGQTEQAEEPERTKGRLWASSRPRAEARLTP
jgi:hypothetical protein